MWKNSNYFKASKLNTMSIANLISVLQYTWRWELIITGAKAERTNYF